MQLGRNHRNAQCIIMLLIVGFAGCSPLHQLTGAAPPTQTPATFAIGLVGAAAGPGDFEASFTGNAAQLAVDEANDAGGIRWQGQRYRLTLVAGGNADIAQSVRSLALATPAPVAIIGPDESAPALAALSVVQSTHIPEISIATTPALTDPARNQNDTRIFRARASDVVMARAVTTYAVQHLAAHAITVASSDNDYGHGGGDVITRTLADLGVPAATPVMLTPGALDFTAQVAQVVAAHSDTVICWSTEIEAAALLHALRAAGWHGHFIVGVADADFIALAGADADGIVGATTWSDTLTTPTSQQFVQAYTQRYGSAPDEHAAAAYDAVQVLVAAIRAVGPDHTAIARDLATLTGYAGVQGSFDAANAAKALGTTGDLTTALEIVQVQHGQHVLLATQG